MSGTQLYRIIREGQPTEAVELTLNGRTIQMQRQGRTVEATVKAITA